MHHKAVKFNDNDHPVATNDVDFRLRSDGNAGGHLIRELQLELLKIGTQPSVLL